MFNSRLTRKLNAYSKLVKDVNPRLIRIEKLLQTVDDKIIKLIRVITETISDPGERDIVGHYLNDLFNDVFFIDDHPEFTEFKLPDLERKLNAVVKEAIEWMDE